MNSFFQGRNDEIPYEEGYADSVYFYTLPFGTNVGGDNTYDMAIKDGKPVFLPTTEEYRKGIEAMHKTCEQGLIDPEIFTQDDTMRDSKLMSKTPVIGSAPGWTTDSTFGANADQYVPLPALKEPDDASIQNFYGGFDKAVKKNSDGNYKVLKPDDGSSADTFAWVNSLRDFGPKYVDDEFNARK